MTQPFRSPLAAVKPEWIDYNGHLNMAYYSVLMDESGDAIYPEMGFGPDYLTETGCTTYVVEFHICYLRELHAGARTYCTVQLLGYDAKRMHLYYELFHEDGWLSATGETLTLHVNQKAEGGPKTAPMPPEIQANLAKLMDAHSALPAPPRAGRRISLAKG